MSERTCPMHIDEPMHNAVRVNRRMLGLPPQPCTCETAPLVEANPVHEDGIASVTWRHRMARPVGDGEAITWCVCLAWSVERGSLHEDEQAWNAHLAQAVLAHLRAVAADEGVRERVAATLAAANYRWNTDTARVAIEAFLGALTGEQGAPECPDRVADYDAAAWARLREACRLAVDADSGALAGSESPGQHQGGVTGPSEDGERL